MNKKQMACTSILVGKKATIDGSTIISRDEDYYSAIGPKAFTVRSAKTINGNFYLSPTTGVKIPLPSHAMRYTCEPSPCETDIEHLPKSKYPLYEGAGINEKNVAMSATETTYSNQRFLGCDPLVKHGINEDCMVTITLPYINSARGGVKRLGRLIEKYGTGQSNGISFADKNEVWYFETAGGHHWVAIRIPDDCYAIAPNQINIQTIDFNDKDHRNYMWSTGLKDFVEKNHLNPSSNEFNFRNIAGTHTEWDSHYNTPRAWYGLKLFSPKLAKEYRPTSQEIPFIRHANRKLTIEDVQFFQSSHYQQTPYDPFEHRDMYEHPKFRPISIDRNQISHILQIRNDVPDKYAALEWVAMGFLAYSPYIPFYANINRTPKNFQIAGHTATIDSNYWMYKILSVLVEPHYHHFIDEINQYRKDCGAYGIQRIKLTDKAVKSLSDVKLTKALTSSSLKTADHITKVTKHLISDLIKQSLMLSKITYD